MSFKFSLDIGRIGEVLYYEANNGLLERTDGRAGDFRIKLTGELLELKLDSYNMANTPNMFVEHFSSIDKKTPGGPWQAQQHGCKYFCYMYVQNLKVFKFVTEELVKRVEELEPQLKKTHIQNKGWVTEGYLVDRKLVEDLAEVEELEIKIKEKKK